MKKAFVWALMAILAVAGSAFAGVPGKVAANATFPTGSPATTNNDDSCDIGNAPAATLLLPYFEVDLSSQTGPTTVFTITNVSQLPQIAHVTLWTDWSFPVLDFNIFLTGYDVQAINLYDIIERGQIAPPSGTTIDTPEGDRSAPNDSNPVHFGLFETHCANLAVNIPAGLLSDVQNALTIGRYGSCTTAGDNYGDGIARGYVTIDVARDCNTYLPYDPTYYTADDGIAFDNTLIGDYEQIDSDNNFAQGNPLVSIRAVPDGGVSGVPTNFDRTFYSRYQSGATLDRRQPLPSTFAARWIEGGSGSFNTWYKIWREGVTGNNAQANCAAYSGNAQLVVTELVRFDEEENPTTFTPDVIISPAPEGEVVLPETSRTSTADTGIYPPNSDGAVAGWMYLNLDNAAPFDAQPGVASQNWVIVSMAAEGRYSVDFDAAWLGNGCSPVAQVTDPAGGLPAIGPAPDVNP